MQQSYSYMKNRSLQQCSPTPEPTLLIHGGVDDYNDEHATLKIEGMKNALRAGIHLLRPTDGSPGSALDAVEAAVRSMERNQAFNAGYGSVLNIHGNVEMDASIMDGDKLRAGCITLLRDIMHPISVARRVMESTNHTFLGGSGAQQFAIKEGFEELPQGSLVTDYARRNLAKYKEQGKKKSVSTSTEKLNHIDCSWETGTVGAVAIDSAGNIAAATSTGGVTGKIPGRIGDSPIIGSGTYADNLVGGVSSTGHGETIMRFNLAQKILEKIRCCNLSAQEATAQACEEMTARLTGTGGAITIDANGEVGIYWTSDRMPWAYVRGKEMHYGVDHDKEFQEEI